MRTAASGERLLVASGRGSRACADLDAARADVATRWLTGWLQPGWMFVRLRRVADAAYRVAYWRQVMATELWREFLTREPAPPSVLLDRELNEQARRSARRSDRWSA